MLPHANERALISHGVLLYTVSKPISIEQTRDITSSVYLTRREAAHHMNISEKFLATHRSDGPKFIRVGSMVRYRLADIEAWMRQQEVCR